MAKKQKKGTKEIVGKDMQDSIKLAIEQINKDFGQGTVNLLGDAKPVPIPRIDSGSIKLNDVLGGGYPLGRIVEIIGPESSGKCLTEDTMILTPDGYKTIREIFKENGLDTKCIVKNVEVSYPLINKDGEEEPTTHFVYNGRRDIYKVRTRTGLEINATRKHPLLVINKDGLMVWKHAEDIEKGDYLVTRRGDNISSRKDMVSIDDAYVIGTLVADGGFYEGRMFFTNNDPYIKKKYYEFAKEKFGEEDIKEYEGSGEGTVEYHINKKDKVNKLYNDIGVSTGVAKDKYIPHSIMQSSIEVQKSFIRGYMDCECSVDTNHWSLEVTSASRRLLREVQLVLKNMGIISMLKEKVVKGYEHNQYWRLSIYGSDFSKYIKEIGFSSPYRKDLVKDYKENTNGSSNHDCIPNIQSLCKALYDSANMKGKDRKLSSVLYDLKKVQCSRNNLSKFLNIDGADENIKKILRGYLNPSLYFDEVIEDPEKIGDAPTFDFSMERTHTFIAESIVNHNTTVALHAVAELQRQLESTSGKAVLYVDAEHALDLQYAEALGVDTSSLILTQPSTAEEAFQVVDKMLKMGVIGGFVIDSVASLVPRTELEGEIGDSHVGTLARLMSQTLRMLTGTISKTNAVAIFINQIREKVGVMWGNPETTPGNANTCPIKE